MGVCRQIYMEMQSNRFQVLGAHNTLVFNSDEYIQRRYDTRPPPEPPLMIYWLPLYLRQPAVTTEVRYAIRHLKLCPLIAIIDDGQIRKRDISDDTPLSKIGVGWYGPVTIASCLVQLPALQSLHLEIDWVNLLFGAKASTVWLDTPVKSRDAAYRTLIQRVKSILPTSISPQLLLIVTGAVGYHLDDLFRDSGRTRVKFILTYRLEGTQDVGIEEYQHTVSDFGLVMRGTWSFRIITRELVQLPDQSVTRTMQRESIDEGDTVSREVDKPQAMLARYLSAFKFWSG